MEKVVKEKPKAEKTQWEKWKEETEEYRRYLFKTTKRREKTGLY